MLVIPLQSGSKGNCYYVESQNTRILVDAGITMRQARLRLEHHGKELESVTDLLVTHDHSDHCRYLADYSRRLDVQVHVTRRTLNAISRNKKSRGEISNVNVFSAGQSLTVGSFEVHSVPTPHDAVDGVAFIIENENQRVGILTDLGHAFAGLREILQSLDAVIIESNYDEEMLNSGPYPEFLKKRIRGSGGHLSNEDSARLIHDANNQRLQWVCLCHLSDENNCPDAAIRTHQDWLGENYPLYIAKRHEVSEVLELQQFSPSLAESAHKTARAANKSTTRAKDNIKVGSKVFMNQLKLFQLSALLLPML